jgi:hypothetical protein
LTDKADGQVAKVKSRQQPNTIANKAMENRLSSVDVTDSVDAEAA